MDRKTTFQPLAFSMTVLAALVRLVPHPPNFAPIGSVALFGGARLNGWQAYVVPLLAMLLTDPIRSRLEGGYPPFSAMTPVIYASFLVSVFLGRTLLRNSNNALRIGGVTFLGSLQFFLITNFAVWAGARDMYPATLSGLVACYEAALPFFGRTLGADLFYTAVMFTVYALLSKRLAPAQQVAV